jgi:hypothetical protein
MSPPGHSFYDSETGRQDQGDDDIAIRSNESIKLAQGS